MRLLLAGHPTVGHTQALRAVGRELLSRGHAVRFAMTRLRQLPAFLPMPAPLRAAQGLAKALAADGFTLVPLAPRLASAWAGLRVAASRGYDELEWALQLFTGDVVPCAKALLDELRARPAEVVVADCFHYGAWLAAETAGVPFVAVFHSGLPFPAPGHPPFGSPLADDASPARWAENQRRLDQLRARVDLTLGQARRSLGLAEVAPGVLERPYARGLNVLTTFEQFELPRPGLAATADGPLLWAGPCLGSSRPAVEFPWERLEGARPLVYVSLGTVFNGQPDVYRALVAGVHAAGARAVVAAGASLQAVLRVARSDDVVVRFAPQVELLPRMSAVVVHGGNNSTNEALRAGRPMLSVPFGGEQVANARRAVGLGVARALDASTLEVSAVAEALAWLLSPEVSRRAEALARAVPEADGAAKVASELEGRWGRTSW